MRCPYCASDDDYVVDSRTADGGVAVRRRRECRVCRERYSTYERVELSFCVRKRDGTLEEFCRNKVLAGIDKATKNLEVSAVDVQDATAKVEEGLRALGQREVASDLVGNEVLNALKDLNEVAYVRFASVYKNFTSSEDFRRELAGLEKTEHAS